MKIYIEDHRGNVIRVENGEPRCGVDFCDTCGDCLYCYGEDRCYLNADGEHMWVMTEEQFDKYERASVL